MNIYSKYFFKGLSLDEKLTLSEWSDKYRYLSSKNSAEPGRWRTSRVPYLQEIMDVLSDDVTEKVVFMKSAQVGATEIMCNMVGYVIHHKPAPMMIVEPSLDMTKRLSRQRIQTMIDDSPALEERVKPNRERDSGNTITLKEFPGGVLVMTGANSASSLRSMPVKYLMMDEIDSYPLDLDSEGNPLEIAIKRTQTFRNRKIFLASTPTVRNFSHIELEYENSDQRTYYVPCPHCNTQQILKWSNVTFDKDNPLDVTYRCEDCGVLIDEKYKLQMIDQGEWIATKKHPVKGYHINALYSPFTTWINIVAEFLKAKNDSNLLKTWVNTVLGETWEYQSEKVDSNVLLSSREDLSVLPPEILLLTAGVDVQKDRLEVSTIGWGVGQESWVIDHTVLYGATLDETVWNDLDNYFLKTWEDIHGNPLSLVATTIDTGYNADQVYKFIANRQGRRIWAIKGKSYNNNPNIITATSKVYHSKINLFALNTNALKDNLFNRLSLDDTRIHFSNTLNDEYFLQLTSEVVYTKYRRGFPYREYQKIRERNEALDCWLYAYSAMLILNPAWDVLHHKKNEKKLEKNLCSDEKKDNSISSVSSNDTKIRKRVTPVSRKNWATQW